MAKKNNERNIYGIIDEFVIDCNGKIVLPGEKPAPYVEEKKEKPVEKVVENKPEEIVEETVPTEEVEEAPAQEIESEVVAEESNVEIAALPEVDDGNKFIAKTFAQKMDEADEIIQDRYDELKNYALRFKKLKARISRKFDSINKGRLQFVKLSVAGKTLKLFLNMDIDTTDSKFHCKDMRDKKTYVTVPVLLRIKSGRAVKYAKLLIDQCAEFHGLVENKKFQEVDAMALIEEALSAKEVDENLENEVASTEE